VPGSNGLALTEVPVPFTAERRSFFLKDIGQLIQPESDNKREQLGSHEFLDWKNVLTFTLRFWFSALLGTFAHGDSPFVLRP
jgi:hypothetical protein